MPKRAAWIQRPEIILDASLPEPLYKQLYERLRGAILTGQLEHGARLPSTRTLAIELGVSRATTALAYEQLLLEGFLESRVGQGTKVARHLPTLEWRGDGIHDASRRDTSFGRDTSAPTGVMNAVEKTINRRLREIVPISGDEESSGQLLRGGEPALDLFPYKVWARLIARRARHSLREYACYQRPAGYAPLREAIAAHIGITRGVRCTPEQIIITSGSQGALDLAARTLLNPGEAAWVENPGYPGTQGALLAAGARLIPVPVDEQGLNVEVGQRRCLNARLVSITPSHQFPTGVTMSLSRRLALLDWAAKAGAWILEDDYDSEYRFSGRPLEALQGLDAGQRVLYIGTFSKVLFPALRLGYVVAPAQLIDPLLATRQFIDVHIPMLEQMVLADFLSEGHFARHLRHMREHYRRRRDLLHHELRNRLGGLLEVHVPEAGMHLVGWLSAEKDDRRAAALATQASIAASAISKFSIEPLPRGGLLFGYANTSEEGILPAVKRLAAALEQL